MCVGIPMQVLSVDGIAAVAKDGAQEVLIDLSLVGAVEPGEWVLTHLGHAREKIDAEQAGLIRDALNDLKMIMAGGPAGDAFADIEARGPQLPPHLQAAFENGETTG